MQVEETGSMEEKVSLLWEKKSRVRYTGIIPLLVGRFQRLIGYKKLYCKTIVNKRIICSCKMIKMFGFTIGAGCKGGRQ